MQLAPTDPSSGEGALLLQSEPVLQNELKADAVVALRKAETRALDFAPVGRRVKWQGSVRQSGTVIASAPFRVGQSSCRRLSMTVANGGEVGRYDLTACKRGQSDWRLVR
ncbi:MAG: hypothetical protein AAFQ10_06885 [Pseudomonadota bacterium]